MKVWQSLEAVLIRQLYTHGYIALKIHKLDMPVWMMPCYAHLFGKQPSAPKHRWAMVKLMAEQWPFIVPCDWEIRHKHNGSMFETLTALRAEYPNKNFHVVMGMDNANEIKKWHRHEELIATYPCIVVGRGGVEMKEDWFKKPPHRFLDEFSLTVCSEEVRIALETGNYTLAKSRLCDTIWQYIVSHHLYGFKE